LGGRLDHDRRLPPRVAGSLPVSLPGTGRFSETGILIKQAFSFLYSLPDNESNKEIKEKIKRKNTVPDNALQVFRGLLPDFVAALPCPA
jgi:hypothetical protein